MSRISSKTQTRIACVRVPNLLLQTVLRKRFRVTDRKHIAAALISSVSDTNGDVQPKVIATNELAIECGVQLGSSLAAAHGACPELVAIHESKEQTTEALAALADTLGRFGPLVSISAPDTVFIDTTGVVTPVSSGEAGDTGYGVDVSVPALLDVLRAQELQGAASIATTPFLARALVSDEAIRKTDVNPCPAPAHEMKEVARLGLRAVGLPPRAFHALDVVGIRTVGAFMALPSASLARRFGQQVYSLWRQAHGLEHAHLAPYTPEEIIREFFQCDDTVHGLEPLCFSIKSLLDRGLNRLEGRGQGIETLTLEFTLDAAYEAPGIDPEQLSLLMSSALTHLQRPARTHRITITLGHPKKDAVILMQLIRSRLNRQPPSGPVKSIMLEVEHATLLQPKQLELFGDPEPIETIQTTVARLAATLGVEYFTPSLREDYRPERAWELTSMGRTSQTAAPPPGPRPTRLLRTPAPLEHLQQQTEPPGALEGPERLVTGWWDSDPIARDYWVISDRWGRRSWIFRDIASSSWFLHGYFD